MTVETVEQVANRVMQQRGYLVVSMPHACRRGEVLSGNVRVSDGGPIFDYPMVVTSETNLEDWNAHRDVAGVPQDHRSDPLEYFYRVVAE
jgi:hypothetical protein